MSATVFVRNLPFGVTQEQLEQVFGDVGPVKKVDVIKEKGKAKSETQTRGFAFVKFAIPSDAAMAIEKLHQTDFQGRKMQLELAKEKGKKRGERAVKQEKVPEADQGEVDLTVETEVKVEEPTTTASVAVKKEKVEVPEVAETPETPQASEVEHVQSERNARRRKHRELLRQVRERREANATPEEKSVVVHGLDAGITKKALYKKVKKIASVQTVELKEDERTSKPYAIVLLEKVADVDVVIQKLDQHIFKGLKLHVKRLADAMNEKREGGAGLRLIIRNLSFQATDQDLQKTFSQCGELYEARVVRLSPEPDAPEGTLGRSRGFGFVQFYEEQAAQAAVEQLNGLKLIGREIVVDFAVSKTKYNKLQAENAENNKEGEMEEQQEVAVNEDAAELDDEEEDRPEEGGETLEFEEDDGAESDIENDEDMNDASDEPEEDAANKEDTNDQLNRTVFVRNLSFQSTEEGLKAFFQDFGPVEYARIVYDRVSGLSNGVAFVRFVKLKSADRAIARGTPKALDSVQDKKKKQKKGKKEDVFAATALADGDALVLDGRMLSVTRAVRKDDAERLAHENSENRKKHDKRNMYLAYEGTINVNKVADEQLLMPKVDIEKRRRALKEKKEKLKNPLFFVSPVRLSVRNLATSVDDKKLKEIFRDGAVAGMKDQLVDFEEMKPDLRPQDPNVSVKVKMAKVVRDMESARPGKPPRSRGYGFVEFTEHVHALAALRRINNNPKYTQHAVGGGAATKKGAQEQDKPRLIVEFALENHGKLKLREKRKLDAEKKRHEEQALREAQGEAPQGNDKKTKEKKSRGARQRDAKRRRGDGEEVTDEGLQSKTQNGKVSKPKATAEAPSPRPTKRRKKESERKDELDALVQEPARKKDLKRKSSEPQLSRRERKRAKEIAEEKNFDSLVQDYKKALFGKQDKTQQERWFE